MISVSWTPQPGLTPSRLPGKTAVPLTASPFRWLSVGTRGLLACAAFAGLLASPQRLLADDAGATPRPANPKAAKPADVLPRPSGGKGGKKGSFENETIDINGVTRSYRLVVPESIDLMRPVPLVFAFHGFLLDSAEFMSRYSRLAEVAEKEKFILVFPQGLERRWEIFAKNNRDVAFFDVLHKSIEQRYNIDLNRLYVTGMSNGAYFTNLLASQRSDVIAAIAPHSGGPGLLAVSGVKADRKYPVLILHGTLDSIVPPNEGRNTRDLYKQEGHEVELMEIKGLRHFWSTRHGGNARIWEFFKEHPMRANED